MATDDAASTAVSGPSAGATDLSAVSEKLGVPVSTSVVTLWPPNKPTLVGSAEAADATMPSDDGAGMPRWTVTVTVAHVEDPSSVDVGATSEENETEAPPAAETAPESKEAAAKEAAAAGDLMPRIDSLGRVVRGRPAAGASAGASDKPTPKDTGPWSGSDSVSDSDASSALSDVWEVEMALWAYVWVTNVVLGELVLSLGPALSKCRVLELGAGSCLASVVAAMGGARHVHATDIEERGLTVGQLSARLNGVASDRFTFAAFDWTKLDEAADSSWDLVIGADVLYYQSSCVPIAALLAKTLKPGGVCIITDPGRAVATGFLDTAAAHPELRVTAHELPFLRTSAAVIPKMRVIEVVRAASPVDAVPVADDDGTTGGEPELTRGELWTAIQGALESLRDAGRQVDPEKDADEEHHAALFERSDTTYFHP